MLSTHYPRGHSNMYKKFACYCSRKPGQECAPALVKRQQYTLCYPRFFWHPANSVPVPISSCFIPPLFLHEYTAFQVVGCVFFSSSPLYKPSSDVVSGKVCAALEKQIALVTADPYRIAVTLASGFQRGSLTDIGYTVYLIFLAVLPSDDAWEHRAVSGKISFDGNIYFQWLIHRKVKMPGLMYQ